MFIGGLGFAPYDDFVGPLLLAHKVCQETRKMRLAGCLFLLASLVVETSAQQKEDSEIQKLKQEIIRLKKELSGYRNSQNRKEDHNTTDREFVLSAAREWALNFTGNLPNFTCVQNTNRYHYYGHTALRIKTDLGLNKSGEPIKSYGQDPYSLWPDSGPITTQWKGKHKVIVAHVRFVDGEDSYRTISINGKRSKKKFIRVDGGMSTGYYGALLHSIFVPGSKANLTYAGEGQTNGRPVLVFKVDHPEGYGLYTGIKRDGTLKNYIRVGYRGYIHIEQAPSVQVRIAGQSGVLDVATYQKLPAVVRIVIDHVYDVPLGYPIQKASDQIDYGFRQIDGRSYWLPVWCRLVTVSKYGKSVGRTDIKWSNYQKFSTETHLRF